VKGFVFSNNAGSDEEVLEISSQEEICFFFLFLSISSASIVQPRNWFPDWLELQSFSGILALPTSLYLSCTLELFSYARYYAVYLPHMSVKRNVIKVRDCLMANKHEVAINARPKADDSPRLAYVD